MNELKRIKQKLKLLNSEDLPLFSLLVDYVQLCYPTIDVTNSVLFFTAQLKNVYNKRIKELEPESKYKQTEMQL